MTTNRVHMKPRGRSYVPTPAAAKATREKHRAEAKEIAERSKAAELAEQPDVDDELATLRDQALERELPPTTDADGDELPDLDRLRRTAGATTASASRSRAASPGIRADATWTDDDASEQLARQLDRAEAIGMAEAHVWADGSTHWSVLPVGRAVLYLEGRWPC